MREAGLLGTGSLLGSCDERSYPDADHNCTGDAGERCRIAQTHGCAAQTPSSQAQEDDSE